MSITLTVDQKGPRSQIAMDGTLILSVLGLLGFSAVMVFSATLGTYGSDSSIVPLLKHVFSIALGIVVAYLASQIDMNIWQRSSRLLMVIGIVMLALLLLPGLGREVNGSTRWFPIGLLQFQPSEVVKVLAVLYLADHCARRLSQLSTFRVNIIEPALVFSGIAVLLLLEPDYGSTAVILVTVLGMLFLSGIRLSYFFGAFFAGFVAMGVLIFFNPNRLQRVLCFLDPFAEPYGCGYQLVQALIALGSGEWFGVGLGASVQKLFYLPEASNDFLVAVIGEELGLVGIAVLIALYVTLCWRAFRIADRAGRAGQMFQARVAQGLGLLLTLQVMVNLAVNLGVIPTKGLTLPLMSYGGSSMISCCFAIGLLLSVDRCSQRALGTKP
ncbi:MAG TPA: putative lipid II flippase FtsW [Gammaproteobacteria bacterium]|mgnify:FL=1|nr:putative lipid II flippase FtsW [Gammaproteobacteria bacterium]RTZ61910.1 MAG: putative lipid II flippase FtsW [Gammaproteobacteria bacterium]HBK77907.1 putative lipid II flippase FtsW [Gammaproteobacteria bacterium]HHZ71958.1 putative lipid II flippase FtsW [Gammaproteobacteria bacterium]HIA40901.1 putative lipid II flippase FtsW [Gammaproteobacteria bacterium]